MDVPTIFKELYKIATEPQKCLESNMIVGLFRPLHCVEFANTDALYECVMGDELWRDY